MPFKIIRQDITKIEVSAIRSFLSENDMTVYLTVFDKESLQISEELIDPY